MASNPNGCRQVFPSPRPPPGSPGPLQTPVQPQSPDRAWPDQTGLCHWRGLPEATQRAGGPGLSHRTTSPRCPGDLVSCPAGPAPSICTEITFPVTCGSSFSLWSWGRAEPSDLSPWSCPSKAWAGPPEAELGPRPAPTPWSPQPGSPVHAFVPWRRRTHVHLWALRGHQSTGTSLSSAKPCLNSFQPQHRAGRGRQGCRVT